MERAGPAGPIYNNGELLVAAAIFEISKFLTNISIQIGCDLTPNLRVSEILLTNSL